MGPTLQNMDTDGTDVTQTTPAAAHHSLTKWARILAWTAVVSTAVMSIAGVTVRLTGSGLGCSTWPDCQPGSLIPVEHAEMEMFHQMVEFIHRGIAVIVLIAFLGTFVLVWRIRPRRRQVLSLAAVGPVGVLFEATLGGVVVLSELQWWLVGTHFLVSLILIFVGTIVAVRLGETDGPIEYVVPRPLAVFTWVTAGVLGVVVLLGIMTTGSGPHAGDASVQRLSIPMYHLAPRHEDWMHIYLGMLVTLIVVFFIVGIPRRLKIAMLVLIGLTIAQGTIGIVQYALGVPEVLVGFHILGAVSLVSTAAFVGLATRIRHVTSADGSERQGQPQAQSHR